MSLRLALPAGVAAWIVGRKGQFFDCREGGTGKRKEGPLCESPCNKDYSILGSIYKGRPIWEAGGGFEFSRFNLLIAWDLGRRLRIQGFGSRFNAWCLGRRMWCLVCAHF